MRKKLISLSLALVLLLSLSAPVMAEETQLPEYRKISVVNLKNFEKLVENCRLDSYSQNLLVSLETDLDLEGVAFEGIPIFCGTFEGNGHTIRGIRITGEGSDQGFFRYLTETAVVQNLHLEGAVCPEGSASGVGGMVGSNSGTIRGCSFPVRNMQAELQDKTRCRPSLRSLWFPEAWTAPILWVVLPEEMPV